MNNDNLWDGEIGDGFVMVENYILDHPHHVEFVTTCRKANLKP